MSLRLNRGRDRQECLSLWQNNEIPNNEQITDEPSSLEDAELIIERLINSASLAARSP